MQMPFVQVRPAFNESHSKLDVQDIPNDFKVTSNLLCFFRFNFQIINKFYE